MPRPRNRLRTLGPLLVALAAPLATAHAQESSVPITYQGVLSDAGQPASGVFDLIFRLWDAPSGGTQLGVDAALAGVEIEAGLFTVQLDFGDGAWQNPAATVHLETLVAPEGSGIYETLAPRQPITPAPIAVNALNHPIGLFDHATEGLLLRNAAAPARLLLNRALPLNPGDFLSVDVPASAGTLGGVVVNHQSPAGIPYYAYASGGLLGSFTYHDPATEEWRVNNLGDRLTIGPSGSVEAAVRVVSPEFRYDAPAPRVLTLHPASFSGFNGSSWQYNSNAGWSTLTGAGSAQLLLPDGAVVTDIVAYLVDLDSSSDLRINVLSHDIDVYTSAGLATLASFATTGWSNDVQTYAATSDRDFAPFQIDNANYSYLVSITIAQPGQNWSANTLRAIQVLYTVPGPD